MEIESINVKKIIGIFGFICCLILAGCSGGGGESQVSTSPISDGNTQNLVRTTEIIISLEGLLVSQATAQSKSMIRKAILPNLGAIQLEITAQGLAPLILNFGPESKTAKIQLAIGHQYVIRVIALDTSGDIISEGSANLDLLAEPNPGEPPQVSVKMKPVDPSDIQIKILPDGGNVFPGQLIYAYLSQKGKIHYKVNDEGFHTHDNALSTDGQNLTTENGVPIQLSGRTGDVIKLTYLAEDLEGKSSPIKTANFSITLPSSFEAMEFGVVKSSKMTSPDFVLYHVNPVNR